MCSTGNSNQAHGTSGSPQTSLENNVLENTAKNNSKNKPKVYEPTSKHEEGGYGSKNPIKSKQEGQKLLETGYENGKQVYNVTDDGKIVKFQPANTSNNEYHAYEVHGPRDIPNKVLKQMLDDGKISKSEYNKLRKGKKKK
jgi:hypothetical protein